MGPANLDALLEVKMKRVALLLVIGGALAACGRPGEGGSIPAACPSNIDILGISGGFSPNRCSVKKDETRTFTNKDSQLHNASFTSGATPPTTGNLKQNEVSGPIRFNLAGELEYVCSIHPTFMKAIIVVTP
ncbi:MAG: plastocyanin/azurin family copper-binding protein [Deinococcota bacterium]